MDFTLSFKQFDCYFYCNHKFLAIEWCWKEAKHMHIIQPSAKREGKRCTLQQVRMLSIEVYIRTSAYTFFFKNEIWRVCFVLENVKLSLKVHIHTFRVDFESSKFHPNCIQSRSKEKSAEYKGQPSFTATPLKTLIIVRSPYCQAIAILSCFFAKFSTINYKEKNSSSTKNWCDSIRNCIHMSRKIFWSKYFSKKWILKVLNSKMRCARIKNIKRNLLSFRIKNLSENYFHLDEILFVVSFVKRYHSMCTIMIPKPNVFH